MDELQMTAEALIDLDEPEALLDTLKRAVKRKKGERWQRLGRALEHAQTVLDRELEAPADAKPDDDSEAKPE